MSDFLCEYRDIKSDVFQDDTKKQWWANPNRYSIQIATELSLATRYDYQTIWFEPL